MCIKKASVYTLAYSNNSMFNFSCQIFFLAAITKRRFRVRRRFAFCIPMLTRPIAWPGKKESCINFFQFL